MRRFVIGDIHGCSKALRSLIEAIDPCEHDELVFLGDYVDRGPDSRDVVDQLLSLQDVCRVVPLRGNHEIMLMGVAERGLDGSVWLRSGGQATLTSYGGSLAKIPDRHREFFRSLRAYYETSDAIFVHAGYQHDRDMDDQDDSVRYWSHLTTPPPPPHFSGKRVFVGHTPQAGGCVLNIDHLVCVDTYCFGGGFLTALNLESFEVIQTNLHGHLRRSPARALIENLQRMRARIGRLWAGRDSQLPTDPQQPPISQHPEHNPRAIDSKTVSPAGDQSTG
jgi:serine/threonine protein phosphatase 1